MTTNIIRYVITIIAVVSFYEQWYIIGIGCGFYFMYDFWNMAEEISYKSAYLSLMSRYEAFVDEILVTIRDMHKAHEQYANEAHNIQKARLIAFNQLSHYKLKRSNSYTLEYGSGIISEDEWNEKMNLLSDECFSIFMSEIMNPDVKGEFSLILLTNKQEYYEKKGEQKSDA